MGVLNTLATRALRISDNESLDRERTHLLDVFVDNGYSRHLGRKAFHTASKKAFIKKEPKERHPGVHLPYIEGTTDRIAQILRKFDIPSTFRPLKTIRNSLWSVKDPVNPKDMKGVYLIPCSCGTPYIGETGRSIHQRICEHAADLRHGRTKSSTLAEHADKTKHHVCIEEAKFIARVDRYHHRKLREAIEIERRPINLNRDDGWKVSRNWIPALSS